ncbi:hypothetical protein GCM10010924_27230 [Rhizobium wenxiniae]|uniref:Uncharacterized protein n=1 Tax=Rhizobium wenxiniae TaxID=1737357 RepID=A0A7W9Y5W7_9HYPH|nr:plant virulence effector HPE1-like domain-containing protein [Rhizobium wenxiniae]MBB6162569.1 hypothetical protein [Rhizobium wenxiniae]GGF97630.1 hypothetical protein GCM10010924_27230 [Rhizobium wenxiniae]
MRHLALTAFVLFAGTAQAQSVMPFPGNTHGTTPSMLSMTCETCPPLKTAEDSNYKVPELKGSIQSVSLMEIDGQKKIVRTNAWMGGSPVVHISKVPDWMNVDQIQAVIATTSGRYVQTEVQTASHQADLIDLESKTGAVEKNTSSEQNVKDTPLRLSE